MSRLQPEESVPDVPAPQAVQASHEPKPPRTLHEPHAVRGTRRLRAALASAWRQLQSAARLACGVPDYDTYVAHLRRHHPGRAIPGYAEFFAERQRARYGAGRSRCC